MVPARRSSLPAPSNLFIGRNAEIDEVAQVLRDPACRLLTLSGPGGIGKTRLAIEVARALEPWFGDGAYFVQLQAVSAPEFIVPTIADTLGLTLRGQTEPEEELFDYLHAREILLLLDNLEHLIEAVDLVDRLLSRTAGVKILVTSREALNLREEWVHPLSGLAFPPGLNEPNLNGYDAVRLFCELGRRAARPLTTPLERSAIARITQLVEGMPLGIELAASWLRSMSVEDIALEIERNRDFLSTTMRNVPERHRSMRAIFEESWRLLNGEEREAFRRLSAFRGSFEREAAAKVADASAPLLSALVDKSLLRSTASGRYEVHELLRQFAHERLAESALDVELAGERHCLYYMNLLGGCFQGVLEGNQLRLCIQAETEIENLRSAWQWAVEHAKVAELGVAGQALSLFFQYKGRYSECVVTLERAVEGLREHHASPESGRTLATLLAHLAWAYLRVGRLDEMDRVVAEAEAIYEKLGELPAPGWSTDPESYRGILATVRGDYTAAAAAGERARSNAERQGNPWNLAVGYYVLTRAALLRGDFQAAEDFAEKALATATVTKDRWFQAYCLIELGNVAAAQGDYRSARAHYAGSYDMRREFGDPEGMALALGYLGDLALRQGDVERALSELTQSLSLYEEINDRGGLATTLSSLGRAATVAGEYENARAYFARCVPVLVDIWFIPRLLWAVMSVGELLCETGELDAGLPLLRVSALHPSSDSDTREAARRLLQKYFVVQPPEGAMQVRDIELACSTLEHALCLPASRTLTPLVAPLLTPEKRDSEGARGRHRPDDLTEREVEVIGLIAHGKSNREIAASLVISVNTAANHVKNILSKIGASNRTEAAAYAIEHGLL